MFKFKTRNVENHALAWLFSKAAHGKTSDTQQSQRMCPGCDLEHATDKLSGMSSLSACRCCPPTTAGSVRLCEISIDRCSACSDRHRWPSVKARIEIDSNRFARYPTGASLELVALHSQLTIHVNFRGLDGVDYIYIFIHHRDGITVYITIT